MNFTFGVTWQKKSTTFPSQPTRFLNRILAIKEEYTLCVEKVWIQNLFTDFLSVSQVPWPTSKSKWVGYSGYLTLSSVSLTMSAIFNGQAPRMLQALDWMESKTLLQYKQWSPLLCQRAKFILCKIWQQGRLRGVRKAAGISAPYGPRGTRSLHCGDGPKWAGPG